MYVADVVVQERLEHLRATAERERRIAAASRRGGAPPRRVPARRLRSAWSRVLRRVAVGRSRLA